MTHCDTFQKLILTLQNFWSDKGCLLMQPYDMPMGAGTFHPATCLRALGEAPWSCAYVQPCRRPTDGRYGENPNRLQHYYQFQVLLKPSPDDVQELYLASLEEVGITTTENDIRFVEDNWESPTLGAWGLGWEVWLNGMEVTQFTYFQQVGGMACSPVSCELTYGLERLAMHLQQCENVYQLTWADTPSNPLTYGDVYQENERQMSHYNFSEADIDFLLHSFSSYEQANQKLNEQGLPLAAYDQVLLASHAFNLLDARNAISAFERQRYILRVRTMTRQTMETYVNKPDAH